MLMSFRRWYQLGLKQPKKAGANEKRRKAKGAKSETEAEAGGKKSAAGDDDDDDEVRWCRRCRRDSTRERASDQ
jgi:hypothetical protein